jgi:hypothetical protein
VLESWGKKDAQETLKLCSDGECMKYAKAKKEECAVGMGQRG